MCFNPIVDLQQVLFIEIYYSSSVNIIMLSNSLPLTFTLNSWYLPICVVRKPKFCAAIYCNTYCYNIYQYCCLPLYILTFIYTAILHFQVTLHYKPNSFHLIWYFVYLYICGTNWKYKLIIRVLVKYLN